MSRIKHHLEEQERKRQIAVDIALETGLLEQCECCEDITRNWDADPTAAYKRANQLISQGDDRVSIFGEDRRELTDTIKAILDDYGSECLCEQRMNSDD